MTEISPEDIQDVLDNPGFVLVIERVKEGLTRKVMAKHTPEEDRAAALADYHAVERIMTALMNATEPT